MLEGLVTSELSQSLGIPDVGPKSISRHIMHLVSVPMDMREVERLDKHLDAIVFCFGSIFKLGLSPQQAAHALEIVMQANMQKLHAGKDEHGKQLKPDSFIGPEAELQKILDKRDSL
jgi:predicted HAD superfamily Cof-like phosphohydrolase